MYFFKVGDRVRVIIGPHKGWSGTVVQVVSTRYYEVQLTSEHRPIVCLYRHIIKEE